MELRIQPVGSQQHVPVPNIRFYRNEDHVLQELHGGYHLGKWRDCIVGVLDLNGILRQIYDSERKEVMVDPNMNIIRLTKFQIRQLPYGRRLPQRMVVVADFEYNFH
ncbi:uncharacterized protein LOC117171017 [Belonocnema kinseyi]|uniref:uncharacterized protein LOC117171017 n=1 Tax=Belonocnema kinseyi TaxID=2817044 RepID=UPI00143D434B|nr:uncharacterized protein LOC117171017 [Belonocnema kinseyi]